MPKLTVVRSLAIISCFVGKKTENHQVNSSHDGRKDAQKSQTIDARIGGEKQVAAAAPRDWAIRQVMPFATNRETLSPRCPIQPFVPFYDHQTTGIVLCTPDTTGSMAR